MTDATTPKLPFYILAGAILGLLVGVAIGEHAAVLQPLGLAYAKMLEIAVFPYLVCSLLVGLGGLSRDRTARLWRASWAVYLVLWSLVFLTIFLIGGFIPPAPSPSLIVPSTVDHVSHVIDLLIPANIAIALDRNFIPAVVVFATLYAVAIQNLPQKAAFLESMEVLRKASVTLWNWIVYVAPFGVFALFASTAGTVDASAAGSLAVYMVLFLTGTTVLAFVILPLLMSRLIPQSYGQILAHLRPALILALVTTLSVSALPFIQRAAEELCRQEKAESEEASDVIKASLSIAYVLSQLGNFFIALFVIFASYHQRASIALWEWLLLPFMTLMSGVGSPSASVDAVAFLSEWLRLPVTETTDLYVETMTVTRYGQVAASVVGFAFVTLTATMIYLGKTRLRLGAIAVTFALTAAGFGSLAFVGRLFADTLFPPPNNAAVMGRTLDSALAASVSVVVHRERPVDLAALPGAATFQGIRTRGTLRVGYGLNIFPFSYFNGAGDLVGYDVAAAYRFARDLHVGIEFYPIDWGSLEGDLVTGRYDIVMAGAYATPDRLRNLSVSDFYLVDPVALIVRSDKVGQFLSYNEIAGREDVHLAVFQDPVLEPLVRGLFPKADITVLRSYDELPGLTHVDGAIWTRDQAAAWTEARSGYTAVVPTGMGAPLPFCYLMPPHSGDMRRYVNLWLALESASGERRRALDYWQKGISLPSTKRRWNLIDDSLLPLFRHVP